MNEDTIVRNRMGYRLRGVVHTPAEGPVKGQPVVLLVPGVDGTKVGPHRLLKKVATVLERRGIVSYRFDLTGQGESDGDFMEITVQTHLNDIDDILSSVTDEDTKVVMAGYSLGGLLAASTAKKRPNCVGLVMLSPALTAADLAKHALTRMEPGQRYYNYGGNLSTRQQVEHLASLDVRSVLHNLTCSSLMITGNSDRMVPSEVCKDYIQEILGPKCAHYRIDHANHSFSNIESEQQVLRLVSDFVCSIAVPV